MGLAVLQQFVGINAIFYYSTTLWQSVGFSEEQSFTTSVITAVVNVVMTFVAILFVDRLGRRKLLMGGSAGMFLGLLLACIAFTQQIGSGDEVSLPANWGVLALVGANLFVVCFAATWGPIMWVMLGEMFPNRMRAIALGLCTAVNWMANFVVALLFPQLAESIGLGWIYGGFAFFALLSFLFVKRLVPETKGMELEEMMGDTNRTREQA
jgi:MFS family permease